MEVAADEIYKHQFTSIEDKRDKIRSNYEAIKVLKDRLNANKKQNKVGVTRATYIKMIFDVTNKFDKQNNELRQAIVDTRRLQKDISNLNGHLERSIACVKETILKDSKDDAWASECYCLLNKVNNDCDRMIDSIQEIGELKREIRQLEDQIGRVG